MSAGDSRPGVWAVVPAAGRSRRMGRPKLLLPVGGKPMIAHVVDELIGGGCAGVVVIVGTRGGPAIARALAGRPVLLAVNDDADGDMLGSIRIGLRQTPQACSAILVALGDQPGIRRELVKRLLAGRTSTRKGILMPSFRGRRGHPVLIANSFRAEILDRFDGVGLRGLAAAHPDQVHEIPIDTAAVLQDVDTPEEYRRWVLEDSGA